MNRIKNFSFRAYKSCAGKGCTNLAKILLKIKFIDRTGMFCESCAADLVQNELATSAGE